MTHRCYTVHPLSSKINPFDRSSTDSNSECIEELRVDGERSRTIKSQRLDLAFDFNAMLMRLFSGQIGLTELAIMLGSLVLAVTVHEFAHALIAEKLGDGTPRLLGRVSLNPLAHLDPLGSLFILLSGFGWGKPVPINPLNFENPPRDSALVSLAGPAANLILASLVAFVLRSELAVNHNFLTFLLTLVSINVALAVFNLLPIFPLDGFKVVSGILPAEFSSLWEKTASYGIFLLIFLVFLPLPGFSLLDLFVQPLYQNILKLLLGS